MTFTERDINKRVLASEVRIALDQHGTYKVPRRGGAIHIGEQIKDSEAEMFLDPSTDWDDLCGQFISVSKGLSAARSITKDLFSPGNVIKAVPGILGYRVDCRQEGGLAGISQNGLALTTLVSAMPCELADWAWLMLGKTGRESLDPNLQMLLNKGHDRLMFSKLVSIGYLVHKIDKPRGKRADFNRRVVIVDDDLNVLKNASRLYQIQGFGLEGKNIPQLKVPGPLHSIPENICIGAGLPELYKFLSVERANGKQDHANLSIAEVAGIIIADSGPSEKPRLY